MDLADLLHDAIEQYRDQLNSSRIAQGDNGRIEILVNPKVRSTRIVVLVEERKVA